MTQCTDLLCHRRNIALSAKSRIHCHQQNHVQIFKYIIKYRQRCCRIQSDTGFYPKTVDQLNGSVKMLAGFRMNNNNICTGLGKFRDQLVRMLDHQVHIKHLIAALTDALDNRNTKRNIRYKGTIHDINVDVIRASLIGCFDIFS